MVSHTQKAIKQLYTVHSAYKRTVSGPTPSIDLPVAKIK